jgi:hypothetical protein
LGANVKISSAPARVRITFFIGHLERDFRLDGRSGARGLP